MSKVPKTLHTRYSNKAITRLDRINDGGEGEIFPVATPILGYSPEKTLLKTFFNPSSRLEKKLEAMIANPLASYSPDTSHKSFALPLDIVYDNSGSFRGYIMPRLAKNVRPISWALVDSSARKKVFNHQQVRVTAALNLASNTAFVHSKGYVIGDWNAGNLFINISQQYLGRISFVDTDSMQVPNPNGGSFRCVAGTLDLTAPEVIHIGDYTSYDKTQSLDLFSLAIYIFQFLYEGYSPYQGSQNQLIAQNIANHSSYLFSKNINPPPYAPTLDVFPPYIRKLFLKCFDIGGTKGSYHLRPTANDWVQALGRYEREMGNNRCSVNPTLHFYGSHLSQCPWCPPTVKKNTSVTTPVWSQNRTNTNSMPTQTSMSGSGQGSGATSQSPPYQGQSSSKTVTSGGVKSVGTKTQHGSRVSQPPRQRSRFMQVGRLYLSRLNSFFSSSNGKLTLLLLFSSVAFTWLNNNVFAYSIKKDAYVCFSNQYTNGQTFTDYKAIKIPRKLSDNAIFHHNAERLTSARKRYRVTPIIENGSSIGIWEGEYLGSYDLIQDREGYMVWKTPPNTRSWSGEVYGYIKKNWENTGSPIGYGWSKAECQNNFNTAQNNIEELRTEYAYSWQGVTRPERTQTSSSITLVDSAQGEEIRLIRIEELRRIRYSNDFKEMVSLKKAISDDQIEYGRFKLCWARNKSELDDDNFRTSTGLTSIAEVEVYANSSYPSLDIFLRQVARNINSSDEQVYEYVGTSFQDVAGSSVRKNLETYVLYIRSNGSLKQIGVTSEGLLIALGRDDNTCKTNLGYALTISDELREWSDLAWEKYYEKSTAINPRQNTVSASIIKTLLAGVTTN